MIGTLHHHIFRIVLSCSEWLCRQSLHLGARNLQIAGINAHQGRSFYYIHTSCTWVISEMWTGRTMTAAAMVRTLLWGVLRGKGVL